MPQQRRLTMGVVAAVFVGTGLLTILCLIIGLVAINRSGRVSTDVVNSSSLRYRTMWIYAATSTDAARLVTPPDWRGQYGKMVHIRTLLSKRYPAQLASTDAAWGAFNSSLLKSGHVSWQQTNTLRATYTTLALAIAGIATEQNTRAKNIFMFAVAGVLMSLVVAGVIIVRLFSRGRSLQEAVLTQLHERMQSLKSLRTSQQLFLSTINSMHEGLVVQNAEGAVEICNPAAEQILGLTAAQMMGRTSLDPTWRCISEDMVDIPGSQHPAILTLMDGKTRQGFVMGIHRANKEVRWVEVTSAPIFQDDPESSSEIDRKPVRVIATFTDITERRQAAQELYRLAAIVEYSQDAVLAVTLDGTLVSWNKGAERVYGYTAPEMIGQNANALAPPDACDYFALIVEAIKGGEQREGIEAIHVRKDGRKIDLSLSFSPILDQRGALVGISCIGRDITERNAVDARIRMSEARLAEAQKNAKMGSYEYDIVTKEVMWSAEVFRLYEIDPDAGMPAYEELLNRYTPSDLIKRNALVEMSIQTGAPFEVDMELDLPSGTKRHVHIMSKPIQDENGKTVRMLGTVMDITERVVSEERFRVLFQYSSEPHLLFSDAGIIDCNPAMIEILRCESMADIVGLYPSFFSPEFQPDGQRSSEKSKEMDALSKKNGFHKFDWTHRRIDGEEFVVEVSLTQVTLLGEPTVLCAWHDLTERLETQQRIEAFNVALQFQMQEISLANEKLGALSTTDGLTDLANHRKFQERLAEEFVSASRYFKPLSLIFIDVDRFKEFNDSFGHPAGDMVLRKVAKVIQEVAREADLAARYGGEEFAIILPDTTSSGAEALAERLRGAVENEQWAHRQITISIGISHLLPTMSDQAELLQMADDALYKAKHSGRNRVHCAWISAAELVMNQ